LATVWFIGQPVLIEQTADLYCDRKVLMPGTRIKHTKTGHWIQVQRL